MATKTRVWPDTPSHPGETLEEELRAREVSVTSVANSAAVSVEQIEAVLEGAGPITAEIAWGLETCLGDISARFWMGLQSDYDLAVARLRRNTR